MFRCTVFRYVTPCSLVDRISCWRNLLQFRGISAQEEAEGTWDILLPSNQTTRLHVPEDLPKAFFKSRTGFRMHRITCVDHVTWISEATTDVCVVQEYVLRGFSLCAFSQDSKFDMFIMLVWDAHFCRSCQPSIMRQGPKHAFCECVYLCRKTENWPSLTWQLLHTSHERNNKWYTVLLEVIALKLHLCTSLKWKGNSRNRRAR